MTAAPKAFVNGFAAGFAYMNAIKGAGTNLVGTFHGATIDANGFPSSTPTGGDIQVNPVPVVQGYGGNFVIKFTGTGAFKVQFNPGTLVIVAESNNTGTHVGTYVVNSFLIRGTNPRVVFTLPVGYTTVSGAFPNGETFTSMNNLIVCRDIDESRIDAGEVFNPDIVADLQGLNLKGIRFMDATAANNSAQTDWNTRAVLDAITYGYGWHTSLAVGTIDTSTDAWTCGAAPSTPGTWTDNEQFQGQFSNTFTKVGAVIGIADNGAGLIRVNVASTARLTTGDPVSIQNSSAGGLSASGTWFVTVIDATHFDLQGSTFVNTNTAGEDVFKNPTINVNGRGAKIVKSYYGHFLGTNFVSGTLPIAGESGTFVYQAALDIVLFYGNTNGILQTWPYELVVSLCNLLQIDCWICIPHLFKDSAVTSLVNFVRDNLTAGLKLYLEFSNEAWNFIFAQTSIATYMDTAVDTAANKAGMGFTVGGFDSWVALRQRQVMGAATAAWSPRTSSELVRVFGQFYYFGTSVSHIDTFRLQGNELHSSGNALYAAKVGVDYNVAPNRPIDFTDALAIAPYVEGTACGDYIAAREAALLDASDDYDSGDPVRMASALQFMDEDVRFGDTGSLQASFTATISGTVMTVTSVSAGALQTIGCLFGPGIEAGALLIGRGTGIGGTGTYFLNWGYDIPSPTAFTINELGSNTVEHQRYTKSSPWAALADSYGIVVHGYEGGFQDDDPSAGQLPAGYGGVGGKTTNLLHAYRLSDNFKEFVQKSWIGHWKLYPSSGDPNWYQFDGGQNRWAMFSPSIYGTRVKSYEGIAEYNSSTIQTRELRLWLTGTTPAILADSDRASGADRADGGRKHPKIRRYQRIEDELSPAELEREYQLLEQKIRQAQEAKNAKTRQQAMQEAAKQIEALANESEAVDEVIEQTAPSIDWSNLKTDLALAERITRQISNLIADMEEREEEDIETLLLH